ncbi:MAG: radical SAM protein [Candidatus Omnitrophica bacterium]|nr:radical SAM protein [Candidatus Omnitrophota bacterium]
MKKIIGHLGTILRSYIAAKAPSVYSSAKPAFDTLVIMVTSRCNARCVMCKLWREHAGSELRPETWERVIREARDTGFTSVHFTGGEPLLYKGVYELASYSSGIGMTPAFTTNGLLIDERAVDKFIKGGVYSVGVSLDAVGEEYERIRNVPGGFPHVKNAIELLGKARKAAKLKPYINFTVMKDTLSTFTGVRDLAGENGLPIALCLLDRSSSIFDIEENKSVHWIDSSGDKAALVRLMEEIRSAEKERPGSVILAGSGAGYAVSYFGDPVQKGVPCISSQKRLYISPEGGVLGGCLSMGSFGDITSRPLRDILDDKEFLKAERKMFFKECAGCSCGFSFNVSHHLPYLIKDALFGWREHISGCGSENGI